MLVGHVGLGDEGGDPEMDLRFDLLLLGRLPLDLADRLFHQLRVELVAHGGDVAGLGGPQEVPRPPDLQVVGGDPETGAGLGEVHDHLEALLCVAREHRPLRDEEVGEGLLIRPPDAPPDLVELGEAEAVRPVDDDRVGRRDVEAGTDDRRAHQDVVLPPDEPRHRPLDLLRRHLPMDHPHLRLRDELLDEAGHREDRPDAVVEEEDLAVSRELLPDRVGDHPFVELQDVGLHRQPVLRRGVDDRQVPNPDERQVERPGDGGRRQGQDVDERPEFFELLLVADAEALLLVDDDQPQVLERDVLLEEAVGADHDVHRPPFEAGEDLLLLGLRPEAVEDLDPDRVGLQPPGEGLVVLLGEDRRGDEDRHLLAVERGPERGAHRHLGLPEPRVAADQAVHRLAAAHVEVDLLDRLRLVRGLLELEGGAELLVDPVGCGEGLPAHHLARGVDRDQLLGHLPDRLLHPLLDRLPGGPAELVDLRDEPVRADVPLDLVEAVDGEVEPILVLVSDQEEVVDDPADGELLEPLVAADPVLGMDDEIPFGELAEGLEEIPLAGRPDPPPEDLLPEDLLFGDQDEPHPREVEAAADPPFPEVKTRHSALVVDPVEKSARRLPDGEVVPGQEMARPLHALLTPADEDHAIPLPDPPPDLLGERPEETVLFGGRRGRTVSGDCPLQVKPDGRPGVVFGAEGEGLQADLSLLAGALPNLGRGQKGGLLFKVEPLLGAGLEEEPVEVVFDLLLGLRDRQGIVQDEEAACREVVEEGTHPPRAVIAVPRGVIEKRVKEGIDRGAEAGGDHLGQFLLRSPRELQFVGAAADVADGELPALGGEDHLAGRKEREFGQLLDGALRGLIEFTDRFELVAEELQTERPR